MENSNKSLEERFQNPVIFELKDRQKKNNRKGGAYFSVPLMAAGVIVSAILPAIEGYRVSKGDMSFKIGPLLYGPGAGFLGSAIFGTRNLKESMQMTGTVIGVCAALETISFGLGYAIGYINR